MVSHQKRVAVIDPSAYSGFANSVVLWIVIVHMMGWGMSRVLAWRVGFDPVWFFDCTACLPRAGYVPMAVPAIGGVSILLVVGAILALALASQVRRGVDGTIFRVLCVGAAGTLALYAAVGINTRYPGSLPGVLIVVVPGAMASIAYLITVIVTGSREIVGPVDRNGPDTMSSVAGGLGLASMVALGGLISVVSLSVGLVARSRARDPRSRRFAFAGIVLGALSFMLRWTLINRYPSIIGLFV